MVQISCSWASVISQAKEKYPHLDRRSFKYKQLVIAMAEKHDLSIKDVQELGIHLGLKLYPWPAGIPKNWRYLLCKSYLSQKYISSDSFEYLTVVPPDRIGRLPYVIHRTSHGYADARWFYEIVPQLEKILKDPTVGNPFSGHFNSILNSLCNNTGNGIEMTIGQVHAINLFFDKYVPGIDLCSTCFKVSLPRSGAGERWICRENEEFEVRLSAAKPKARFPVQQTEYISHSEVDDNGKKLYALWDEKKCAVSFDRKMEQEATHIPWDIYDFNKFSLRMPGCKCKKKL
jgi:hypothetical protein